MCSVFRASASRCREASLPRTQHAGSQFSGFDNNQDSAIRLAPGARATLVECAFRGNSVARRSGSSRGAGPVMGLHTGVDGVGAAAWFHKCYFDRNSAPKPGEVAADNRAARVYSSSWLPAVYDRELEKQVLPWVLVEHGGDGAEAAGGAGEDPSRPDVFADVARERGAFLRPTDPFFRQVWVAGMLLPSVPG